MLPFLRALILVALAGSSAGACGKGAVETGADSIAFVRPRPKLDGGGPIELALGDAHACALLSSRKVACWGDNRLGQIAQRKPGEVRERLQAVLVEDLDDVEHIAAGAVHTCAARRAGSLTCWGSNITGELGGPRSRSTDGARRTHVGSFDDVVASHGASCGMWPNQVPRCFGQDADHRLLRSDTPEMSDLGPFFAEPAAMEHLRPPRQLAFGIGHACALFGDGTVSCWGRNELGQLGAASPDESARPILVEGLGPALQIQAGAFFTCALTADHSVACWGENDHGQLGSDPNTAGHADPGKTHRPAPAKIPGLAHVTEISAGASFACALEEAKTVMCWGENDGGQLGDGTTIARSSPVRVAKLADVVSIHVSSAPKKAFACALTKASKIFCWGDDTEGQLGDLGRATGSEPAEVILP